MRFARTNLAIFALVMVAATSVLTQSGGQFTINKSVIAGGGGSANGGTFSVDGTIGQAAAGTTSSGGTFNLQSGFWAGGSSSIASIKSRADFDGDGKRD